MREGTRSPAYRKIDTFEIKHYLVEHFGRIPLSQLGTFEIQVWLNKLATRYSQSVVLRHASIRTTGDVYMQTIESSVLSAMNSRTMQILSGEEKTIRQGRRGQ
jgi:hypothetical protein